MPLGAERLRRMPRTLRVRGMRFSESGFARVFALAFVFSLGTVCGNCWGSISRAQHVDEVTPALALARLCVSESGTRAYRFDDCASIHAVVAFRAQHIYRSTYLEALHRYSRRATVDRAGRNRPWIAELWPDARRPESWTRRARWEGRRGVAWARTYAHAVDVYRGTIVARCSPHTWARDDVRPADPTAHTIDCGDTLNLFWSVPAYADRWPLARAVDPG